MNKNNLHKNIIVCLNNMEIFIIFYFFILIILPNNLRGMKFFSAFEDKSGNIIIMEDRGISYFIPFTKETKKIRAYLVNGSSEVKRKIFNFAQYPSNNNISIYSISKDVYIYINGVLKNHVEIDNYYFSINYRFLLPYKIEEEKYLSIVYGGIINTDLYLYFSNFSIDIENPIEEYHTIINHQNESTFTRHYDDNTISCQIMKYKNNTNNSLICFVGLEEPPNILAYVFDIESNFTIIDINFYNEISETIYSIKSWLYKENKISFMCYTFEFYITECTTYNSEENIWQEPIRLTTGQCMNYNFDMGFFYLNNTKEYLFYCFDGRYILNFFIFDQNLNLKRNSNNIYPERKFTLNFNNKICSSEFIYFRKENKFLLYYINGDYDLFELELCFNETSLFVCQNNTSDNNTINSNTINIDTDIINISYAINDTININSFSSDIISETFNYNEFNSVNTINTFINSNTIISNKIINNIIDDNAINNNDKIDEIKNINFVNINNIKTAKTNKIKEEIINHIDDIINQIDIGTNYKLIGEDYDIIVSPINNYKDLNLSYIDLGECENILRDKYNLKTDEIISIMAIEIDPLNEKVLRNQIEYNVYDEKKNKLDLSFCQDKYISVNYKIINSSNINKTMIEYFSNLDVDIFDIKDAFFNDICLPFSFSDTDLILRDRINDIYQNYSLCEENCEYENIDIETMSVKCTCQVKTEINIERKPPVFYEIILNTFKDSNFGVLECFRQVFGFSNKLKNYGFLISLIIIILHIPLFIIYFIYKIKSVKDFVIKEMEKNNYLNKIDLKPNSQTDFNETIDTNILDEFKKEKENNDNKTITEVSINNFYIRKNIRHRTQKTLRNTINYNLFYEKKESNTKEPSEIEKDTSKITVKPKNGKKRFINQKRKIHDENNNDNKNASSGKQLNPKKKVKKVKFNISKNLNNEFNNADSNATNNKLKERTNNSIKIFDLRRSVRSTVSKTQKIFERLLGNEEAKKFPGFYNLIHVNANNISSNRPLDSKYILDNFDYENAIKYDKRSFLRIFFICLLSRESILNTFFFKSPLELQSIRLCLFLFSYSCDLALNAFFYSNQNISDRYHYNGPNLFWFSIINNLTISITSTLVSFLLVKFLSFLSNSKDDIVDIFRKEEEKIRNDKNFKIDSTVKSNIMLKLNTIFTKLKFKIISFIIAEILILLFFFYYMTAFCEVYKKTQISWLSDSGVSFLISIPIEFGSALLMSIFYYISIRYKKKCIYNTVMFFYSLA